jgi:hypothetical protein
LEGGGVAVFARDFFEDVFDVLFDAGVAEVHGVGDLCAVEALEEVLEEFGLATGKGTEEGGF